MYVCMLYRYVYNKSNSMLNAGAMELLFQSLDLNMKSNICEITSFDLIELKLITS